jgi:leucyl aminopeptidase
MEQLVHLRLKSIYKAFQQSARTNDAHPHLKRAALAAMKSNKEPKIDPVLAKAQADAAAAELLAELEQEEDSKPTAKKKRKKKKKGHEEQVTKDAGADQEHETKVDNAQFTGEQSALDVAKPWKSSPKETCHPKDDEDDDSDEPVVMKSHAGTEHPSMDIAPCEPDDAWPTIIEKSAPALNHNEQHSQQVDPMQMKLW